MKIARVVMVLGTLALVCGCVPAKVTIVEDGRPMARIVTAKDAPDEIKSAAQTLANYIEQASGAKLIVMGDDASNACYGVTIEVGKTSLSPNQDPLPKGLDDDGFVIRIKPESIIILGPTPWGTEFGVYEFLERAVGVRWLLPGPDGDDVPTARTISVPVGTMQGQPVFFSRLFSGLKGAPQQQWARFNRMHGRISFHHNLLQVFPPEKYTKTHPEYFPMKDGKTRHLPAKDEHGWQPCFTAPGLADEAVRNIVTHFKEHPDVTSFSLGANDSSGYCRCPACMARITGEKNFLNLTDFSDLYYDWCNKVIDGVLKVYPDKWFGCLAYSEVAAPPKRVKVHPRLIPYMTYDRMKWVVPEIETAGHRATEDWHQASPTLGWYDYIYGTPFCLPRVFFHESGKYLRYAQAQGVKAHYAEIYPNFGEGPKPYIFLKLWWDPNQEVDALLKEWYERCVGPEAAPSLAQYYSIWERFWTQDVPRSKWFTAGGQYLSFYNPGYLADVKEDNILHSRQLLDECIAKCRTEKQRARAKLLELAFQYYEASATAYLANRKLAVAKTDTEEQALEVLTAAANALDMAQKRRRLALEVYPKNAILVNPLGIERFPLLAGENWGGSGFWAVADWAMKDGSSVRRRLEELAARSESATVREQASLLLAAVKGTLVPVSTNISFEEGQGSAAKNWNYWLKPDVPPEKPIGRMLRTEEVAHTGKACLLSDSMLRGGPVQTMDIKKPGKYCAIGWVYVPPGQETKGTVEIAITPLDAKGANLPGHSAKVVPTSGKWTAVVVGLSIPAEIEGRKVTRVRIVPIVDGFQTGGKVYLDDVGLYQTE